MIVMRTVQEVFGLGESSGRKRAPGQPKNFDVSVRSFIPPPWIDGPEWCGEVGPMIYKADNRDHTPDTTNVRTKSRVVLIPDQGSFLAKYNYTGQTRNYEKNSGLAPDGVTLLEDFVKNDCYKTNDWDWAEINDMYIDVSGDAGLNTVEAHIYGDADNPLVASPDISWDAEITISQVAPFEPAYSLEIRHDCFPAFEIYIGKQLVYDYKPSSYSLLNISACLGGANQANATRNDLVDY